MTLHLSPQPNAELLQSLPERAAAELFGDLRFRPAPQTMASLITDGLTEQDIVTAGRKRGLHRPVMTTTLKDLDVSLPYFHQMSDTLADDYPHRTVLFAGRDAEALYDDFAIAHPDRTGHLLPASSDIWDNSSGMGKRQLAAPFLGQYGLTREAVMKRRNRFAVVDSGFHGSIGKWLDERIDWLYGVSLRKTGALSIRLVCTGVGTLGTPIIDLPDEQARPRIIRQQRIDPHRKGFPNWVTGHTFGLAVGMQLMPRYHEAYAKLSVEGERVVALPDDGDDTIVDNVDDAGTSINTSVVNPVAAAITQFRVVNAALLRFGNTPRTVPEQDNTRSGILAWIGRLALGK